MQDRDLSANKKYYESGNASALHTEVRASVPAPSLKTTIGTTDSISDVSDIARVLDSACDLIATGVVEVHIPVVDNLTQKARTNLDLRVGRGELTTDQTDGIRFVLLEPAVFDDLKEEVEEEHTEVEFEDIETEEELEEEELEEEELEEEELEEEDIPTPSDKSTPSIASLFGATDDDDGDD